MTDYLHGYHPAEQQRLVDQANYWRDTLILPDLPFKPFDRVLDIGCGVGAVLGVLAQAFKGLRLAGIDIEPKQVAAARAHLAALGHPDADLRAGDASRLPWPDHTFDHVYMMWFIEHLSDPQPILREALRVLKPGGTITINETDYTTFKLTPASPDWDHLEHAQFEHFRRHGQPQAGLNLAPLLHAAGFAHVAVRPMGFHFSTASSEPLLRAHADYLAGFLEPAIPDLAKLGFDVARMTRGVAHLRSLHTTPAGALTNIVYRARATRPHPPHQPS